MATLSIADCKSAFDFLPSAHFVPSNAALDGIGNCTTIKILKCLPSYIVRCALLLEQISPIEVYFLEFTDCGSISLFFGRYWTSSICSELDAKIL